MSRLISIIAVSMLAVASLATWVGPIQLLDLDTAVSVESVYRDPTSLLTHVIAMERSTSSLYHFAVSDTGAIVYNYTFPENDYSINAVVQGAGDGLKIFAACSFRKNNLDHLIRFRESADGGKTWSKPIVIVEEGSNKRLQDMIYVVDTGRIYVFFTTGHDLRVVSRAQGSIVFGSEVMVGKRAYSEFNSALASYNINNGKSLIHVVFKNYDDLSLRYTSSSTNGVTWEKDRDISGEPVEGITNIVSNEKVGPSFFVAYATIFYGPAKMVYSKDFGKTFSRPMIITNNNKWSNNMADGMAVCGSSATPLIASLFVTKKDSVEYGMWDLATMKPTYKDHPYTMTKITTAGLDCQVDEAKSLLNVTSFVSVDMDGRSYLFFGAESDVFFSHSQ